MALIAAALALASSMPATAVAGSLRIVSEDLSCPSRDRIEANIQRALAGAMELQPDLVLVLESRPPAQLVLRLQGSHAVSERVIDLPPSACAELSRSVVLLIRGWLDRRWSDPPPPSEGTEPQPAADLAAEAPPAEQAWARLHLSAAAGPYLAPGTDASVGLRIVASAEWELSRRWALGLLGSRDAPVPRSVGSGSSVSVGVWRLALFGRASLLASGATAVDLLAGPALEVLDERSDGFAAVASKRFVDVGLVAAARWRRNLSERLALFGALEVDVRTRRERLKVEGLGDVLTVSPVRMGLWVGAEVAL